MRKLNTLIIILASVAVIGIALNAFAHSGMGWHHQRMYGSGYEDQMSKEQYKQFEQKRDAFYKETEDLRANLYEKERELQNELAKSEPDASTASGLQKEISKLQAQLDQKRIDHMVEMKIMNPKAGHGFMHSGPMMGYGPRGSGYCW